MWLCVGRERKSVWERGETEVQLCFWRRGKVNDLNPNKSRRWCQRSFIKTCRRSPGRSRRSTSTSPTHNSTKGKRLHASRDRSEIWFHLLLTLAGCPELTTSAVTAGGIGFLRSSFQTKQKKKKEEKWAPPEITSCLFAAFITKHMPNVAGIPAGSAGAGLTLASCISSSSSSGDFKGSLHYLQTCFLTVRRNRADEKRFFIGGWQDGWARLWSEVHVSGATSPAVETGKGGGGSGEACMMPSSVAGSCVHLWDPATPFTVTPWVRPSRDQYDCTHRFWRSA